MCQRVLRQLRRLILVALKERGLRRHRLLSFWPRKSIFGWKMPANPVLLTSKFMTLCVARLMCLLDHPRRARALDKLRAKLGKMFMGLLAVVLRACWAHLARLRSLARTQCHARWALKHLTSVRLLVAARCSQRPKKLTAYCLARAQKAEEPGLKALVKSSAVWAPQAALCGRRVASLLALPLRQGR